MGRGTACTSQRGEGWAEIQLCSFWDCRKLEEWRMPQVGYGKNQLVFELVNISGPAENSPSCMLQKYLPTESS